MSIEVVTRDTDTGETKTQIIQPGEHMVICAAPAYVHTQQVHGNGTRIVTIKRRPLNPPMPTVHFRTGHRIACGTYTNTDTTDPNKVVCGQCERTNAFLDAAIAADLVCGDCEEGRCHWGSRGPAWEGAKCGCRWHAASARKTKLREAAGHA